jgi:hypothetical protein
VSSIFAFSAKKILRSFSRFVKFGLRFFRVVEEESAMTTSLIHFCAKNKAQSRRTGKILGLVGLAQTQARA